MTMIESKPPCPKCGEPVQDNFKCGVCPEPTDPRYVTSRGR